MDIYQVAWQRLIREIERKTGWGKLELRQLMLECLTNPNKKEEEVKQ